MEGKVITYKVGLVAKGNKKDKEFDFDKTFLLVIMLKFIRILLAIIVYNNYKIWKMKVKIAFLNWNLLEDMYITQLESFISDDLNRVFKIQMSIYGLKQILRSWNKPCIYKNISFVNTVCGWHIVHGK